MNENESDKTCMCNENLGIKSGNIHGEARNTL